MDYVYPVKVTNPLDHENTTECFGVNGPGLTMWGAYFGLPSETTKAGKGDGTDHRYDANGNTCAACPDCSRGER